MASIEERLRQLADANLEVDGQPIGHLMDPSKGLFDLGLSSLDIIAFGKVVAREFNVPPFTDEKGAEMKTIGDLIAYLEANAS